jgi:hypothetical protein
MLLLILLALQPLSNLPEVVPFVEGASREIVLYTPALRSRVLAESLHRAIRERGVRVVLLTPYERDPGSYFVGLSLAGASLYRCADRGRGGVLLVDGRYLITGPLVGLAEPIERVPTQLEQTPQTVGHYRTWLEQLRQSAQPFIPERDLRRPW